MSTEVEKRNILRRELFEIWHNETNNEKQTKVVYAYILQHLCLENIEESIKDVLTKKVRNICKMFRQRYVQCKYSKTNLFYKYRLWLQEYISFVDITTYLQNSAFTSSNIGRPSKMFSDCSDKRKRQKVENIVNLPSEELMFATQARLHLEGNRSKAKVIKYVSNSAEAVNKIKNLIKQDEKVPVKLAPDEALASYIQNKFSKSQYIAIHKETKEHNANVYPCYDYILQAKKRCYPEIHEIKDDVAEIKLQALVDHTAKRLTMAIGNIFTQMERGAGLEVLLEYKWGCDGAAGHSQYKQKYTHVTEEYTLDDSFMFIMSLVPIQIVSNDNSKIYWKNNRPSSPRLCRPIKIIMSKESGDLVKKEVAHINEQICNLHPTDIEIDNLKLIVHHKLHLTMIDGKICGILTGTPSSNCYICGCTPKDMNKLESHTQRIKNDSSFSYGLSTLHALIKSFECILHIGYRLEINSWQIRGDMKDRVELRKRVIRDRLRQELGILVDIPKPGFGTTNDGNTARTFFENSSLVSEITGVDETLIYRISIILKTLSCGLAINAEKFETFAFDTAKLYVSRYPWYYMPQTLHKILIHGGEVIKKLVVPIGALSEEAQEAKHKECKRFREYNTRKSSRKATMEDLIHMFLITSDPLINSYRQLPARKSGSLSAEVITLLEPINEADIIGITEDSDSD